MSIFKSPEYSCNTPHVKFSIIYFIFGNFKKKGKKVIAHKNFLDQMILFFQRVTGDGLYRLNPNDILSLN